MTCKLRNFLIFLRVNWERLWFFKTLKNCQKTGLRIFWWSAFCGIHKFPSSGGIGKVNFERNFMYHTWSECFLADRFIEKCFAFSEIPCSSHKTTSILLNNKSGTKSFQSEGVSMNFVSKNISHLRHLLLKKIWGSWE